MKRQRGAQAVDGQTELNQLISAERSLLAALRETDMRKVAALLRCAAKYLEGAADGPFGGLMKAYMLAATVEDVPLCL